MSLFQLKTSLSELSSTNEGITRMSYDQLSASREVVGDAFPGHAIHFRFGVAGQRWWVPSRSYINMRVHLAKDDGTPLLSGDNVALAPGTVANLFQSAEFRINGKTVCHVADNLAAIDIAMTRLRKSKAWTENIGKSTNFYDHDFISRKAEVSSDGLLLPIAMDNPAVNPPFTPPPTAQRGAVELIWQVPLSIFNVSHAIPTGDFELILNPKSKQDYKIAVVESAVNAGIAVSGVYPYPSKAAGAGNDYDFRVEQMLFYAAMVESDPMDNGTYYLDFDDMKLQTSNRIASGTSSITNNFDVSPSTHALTVAFQDTTAGSNTQFPQTKFIGRGRVDLGLNQLRITYAGQTKPSPDWDGQYGTDVDFITQRYYESAAYSGGLFDKGGFENKKEWLAWGPLYHFRWNKDGRDIGSTRVDITTRFASAASPANTLNLLLFEHYKSVAKIDIRNGKTINVQVEAA